jgi:hypothetical protein
MQKSKPPAMAAFGFPLLVGVQFLLQPFDAGLHVGLGFHGWSPFLFDLVVPLHSHSVL